MTKSLTQLVEARFAEAEVFARASRDIGYAGDPLNCADCAIAIERAEQDCLTPGHVHGTACWDDPRCPSHQGGTP